MAKMKQNQKMLAVPTARSVSLTQRRERREDWSYEILALSWMMQLANLKPTVRRAKIPDTTILAHFHTFGQSWTMVHAWMMRAASIKAIWGMFNVIAAMTIR